MQDIEIRRALQAAEVVSIQVNPAVVPGLNGEPDQVVLALEITAGPVDSVAEPGSQIATRYVFAVDREMALGFDIAHAHARSAADQLAEDLK